MTMDYRIQHTTTYDYPIPVSVCHNIVCLSPRNALSVTIHDASLTITPQPTVLAERTDTFGNTIHVFAIEAPHDQLRVHATARLTVTPQPAPDPNSTPAWESVATDVAEQTDPRWLEACQHTYDTPMVLRSEAARVYAEQQFTPGRPILDAALALTARIHEEYDYRPGETHVGTTSEEAIAQRFGVCQDFAHAQLAMLRSLAIPCRYVSGYLRTVPPEGRPRLIGADQSHAWVSVYCGPEAGWVDLDPTNDVICGTDHVPIAIGRDYTDVAPIRGAFLGGGASTLHVKVDVEPVEAK